MSEERVRILAMLQEGKITVDEATSLLDAATQSSVDNIPSIPAIAAPEWDRHSNDHETRRWSVQLPIHNLSGANLDGAILDGADLTDTNLSGANLQNVNLRNANCRNANFSGSNLQDADFEGANLENANLSGSNLDRADFHGADLRDINMSGVNLPGYVYRPEAVVADS